MNASPTAEYKVPGVSVVERGRRHDHDDKYLEIWLCSYFGADNVHSENAGRWIVHRNKALIESDLAIEIADEHFKPPRTLIGEDMTPGIEKNLWG